MEGAVGSNEGERTAIDRFKWCRAMLKMEYVKVGRGRKEGRRGEERGTVRGTEARGGRSERAQRAAGTVAVAKSSNSRNRNSSSTLVANSQWREAQARGRGKLAPGASRYGGRACSPQSGRELETERGGGRGDLGS